MSWESFYLAILYINHVKYTRFFPMPHKMGPPQNGKRSEFCGERRSLRKLEAEVKRRRAQVVELVDTLVLGTSAARREGSTPFLGTTLNNEY